MDELFENIIELLNKIIESGEVDSIKTMSTLQKLISTLKLHSNASYFSLHSMNDFLKHLMKNVLWEQLSSLPIVGPMMKGLKKTIEETDIEMKDLRLKIEEQMKIKYESEFLFLENNPIIRIDK